MVATMRHHLWLSNHFLLLHHHNRWHLHFSPKSGGFPSPRMLWEWLTKEDETCQASATWEHRENMQWCHFRSHTHALVAGHGVGKMKQRLQSKPRGAAKWSRHGRCGIGCPWRKPHHHMTTFLISSHFFLAHHFSTLTDSAPYDLIGKKSLSLELVKKSSGGRRMFTNHELEEEAPLENRDMWKLHSTF